MFLVFQNISFLQSAKQIEKVRILKDSLEFCHFISHRLFCPLSKSELKYTKRSTLEPQHPPMFACITRKADSSEKDLECHGFVCKSTEEAVSVAAHLYQSLVDTVKAQGNNKKVNAVNDILVGNFTIFRFYVKSIFGILKMQNLPFRHVYRLSVWIFMNFCTFEGWNLPYQQNSEALKRQI